MKLILFIVGTFVLGCAATSSTSLDQLQKIQKEVKQLKRSNRESSAVITALKQTYDEKIKTQDDKIASLEQQLRSGLNLAPQSG